MRNSIFSLTLILSFLTAPLFAVDFMGDLNLAETVDTQQNATNDDRAEIIWLMTQMKTLEGEIDQAINERDSLSKAAKQEIADARRKAANARAARDAMALLIGGASAAGQKMAGHNDTSASWEMTEDMLRDNAIYSDYDAANRMRSASSTAQGLYSRAQSMDFQANALVNERRVLQGKLDKLVIKYLRKVNELITSIPGFENSGLGKVKDLAFDPAAGTDKSFDGAIIYSLTFVIDNEPIDVRLSDLQQMIDDDFAALLAQREKELEAANGLELDKYLDSLSEQTTTVNAELSHLRYELKNTKRRTDEYMEIANKISALEKQRSDMQKRIQGTDKIQYWNFQKRRCSQGFGKTGS